MNIDLLEAEVYDSETKCLKLKASTAAIPDDYVTPYGRGQDEYILWKSTISVVHWDVEFINTGQLDIAINMANDEGNVGSEFEIEVDGETLLAVPPFTGGLDYPTTVTLGSIKVKSTGCFSVKLQAKSIKGDQVGKVWYIELSGDAAVDSVEDMLPLGIDNVQLNWIPRAAFDILYCAVTPTESHMGTEFVPILIDCAYMALRDADFEGYQFVNCNCVTDDEAEFEDVYKSPDFVDDSNKFMFPWSVNETYHFLLKALLLPDENAILYFWNVYLNDESKWKLLMVTKRRNYTTLINEFLSAVRSPYGVQTGYFPREAAFGPMWGRLPNGEWKQVTSCDYTQGGTLFNVNAFVKDNRTYLRTGGRTKQTNKLGTVFNVKASEQLPEILRDIDLKLESLPNE